jgi:hypothetical protein
MKPEFKIFKSESTKGLITIMSKAGELFDREAKIKKYLLLGYKVYELNGVEIK